MIQARSKHFKDVELTQAESLVSTLVMTLSAVPDDGALTLDINGEITDEIPFDATEVEIQALVRAAVPAVNVTGSLADEELTFSLEGAELVISEDSNTLVNGIDPVTTTFADVETVRIIDLANYRDDFLEVVYADGAPAATNAEIWVGATREKFLHNEGYDQEIDPLGGVMQFNLNTLLPRYAQLRFPEALITSVRLQGLRLRSSNGR